jgi:hypothetical protein
MTPELQGNETFTFNGVRMVVLALAKPVEVAMRTN